MSLQARQTNTVRRSASSGEKVGRTVKLMTTLVGRDSRSRTHGLCGGSGTMTAPGVSSVLVVFACWAGSFAMADDSPTSAPKQTAKKPAPVRVEYLPPEREVASGRRSGASEGAPQGGAEPSSTSSPSLACQRSADRRKQSASRRRCGCAEIGGASEAGEGVGIRGGVLPTSHRRRLPSFLEAKWRR